jgi:3-deoxy-D-manno-octulosonic-acid transferase
MIIDNIGMLSTLYRYGEVAFVGGAFGDGLHNILEAACYGVPIFFGDKNYEKFQEAHDLIMRGGAFEVSGYSDLKSKYELLNNKPENYLLACEVTKSYVEENRGATIKIVDYCLKLV